VSFGWIGGLTAYDETATLSPCRHWKLQRTGMSTGTCEIDLACIEPRLNFLLSHQTIGSALQLHTLYGRDTRPADGQVLHIAASGGSFDIGICDTQSPCPGEVVELQQLLVDLLAQRPCSP
jgi:hypothetical protein